MKNNEIKNLYYDLKNLESKYNLSLISQPSADSFRISSSIFVLPESHEPNEPFDSNKFIKCINKGSLFKSKLDFFSKLNQISHAWYSLQKFDDPKGIMTDFVATNGFQINKDGFFKVSSMSAYGDKRFNNLSTLSQGPLKRSTVSGILSVASKKGYILKNDVINPGDLKKFFNESRKIPTINKLIMMTYILRYLNSKELTSKFDPKLILKNDQRSSYYAVSKDVKDKYLVLPGDDYID